MPSAPESAERKALPGGPRPPLDQPEPELRMPLSEHLEELRRCSVRALIALLAGCLVCIWPAKYLLSFIAQPVVVVLRRWGQPENLLVTGPAEALLVYIKVVCFSGFVLASPYILYQVWMFISAGLYGHEKRWVLRLLPASIGLFLTGIAFMYTLVLLVSLDFLVGFASWIPLPTAGPTALEALLLGMPVVSATQPALEAGPPAVALLLKDPPLSETGQIWFNLTENRLKLHGAEGVYSVQMAADRTRGLFSTHFRLSEYLSFVMVLTIAFGIAFQTPLVVIFLVRSGIATVAGLRRYRRVVIFVIVVIAGLLAPPDLLSHLLLAGPMVLLFEVGLLLAARGDRRPPAAERTGSADSTGSTGSAG